MQIGHRIIFSSTRLQLVFRKMSQRSSRLTVRLYKGNWWWWLKGRVYLLKPLRLYSVSQTEADGNAYSCPFVEKYPNLTKLSDTEEVNKKSKWQLHSKIKSNKAIMNKKNLVFKKQTIKPNRLDLRFLS